MILDEFRNIEGFPFENYFEDVNQYIQAQLYWSDLLDHVEAYRPSEWRVIPETQSVEEDMSNGRMFWLESKDGLKQIMIHMISIDGFSAELLRDNDGLTSQEENELRDLFGYDFEIDDSLRTPLSRDEAEKISRADHAQNPVKTWVEIRAPWSAGDPSTERLYLTSEISERAEPLAIQALELFMQDGSAFDRVNSVFAPEALTP